MTIPSDTDRPSDRLTTASSSPAGEGVGAPAASQPAGSTPARAKEPAIHCQKCKHENVPNAQKCARCGANLLPGAGLAQRLWIFFSATSLAVTCFYFFFINIKKIELGGKPAIYLVGLLIFGILTLGFGLIQSLRKIPLDERYVMRARRHASLNKLQAIADYGSAMQTAPQYLVLNYLVERAKLYQDLGMPGQAASDWQRALAKINDRIARANPPVPDLFKQRAELYKNLDMKDEYALEMLLYSIEKEKTFKFKEDQVASGMQEGFSKGTEDLKRQEFHKLRIGIMQDPKFRIVAECKKCRATVDLDYKLHCTRKTSHRVTNIRPVLRKPDPS